MRKQVSFPARTGPWGKIVGVFLGLWAGGPWGAVAGLVIGHRYDQRRAANAPEDLWGSVGAFSGNVEQSIFTMGVVALSAKMAKADGRVTRAEIEAFKRVFNIKPEQEAAIGKLFDRARLSADGFEPYALQLAHVFRRNPTVLHEVLSGLFIIAAADYAGLSPAEILFLKRVSYIFGIGAEDFARIAARAGVRMPESERPRPHEHPHADAFAILGVATTATDEEIKAAYRALIREHHPDRLMAQGMPAEFVATATEKMKRINVAYDTIGKMRGMK